MGHLLSPFAFFQILICLKKTLKMAWVGRTAFKAMILGVGDNGNLGEIQLFTDFLPDVSYFHKASIENELSGESLINSTTE